MPNPHAILCLESSGESGGAAVIDFDGRILSEVPTEGDRTHGALLVPCIDAAMKRAGLARAELRGVLVNCGPGSYTGLRVGVAAAEAIGLALSIPVLGVPCFEVMVEEWLRAARDRVHAPLLLIPALDARQHACACAVFSHDPATNTILRLSDDLVLAPEELPHAITGASRSATHATIFGQGATAYAPLFPGTLRVESERLDIRPATVGVAAFRCWPDLAQALASAPPRVAIRYFRPISAKTIAERQAQAGL